MIQNILWLASLSSAGTPPVFVTFLR